MSLSTVAEAQTPALSDLADDPTWITQLQYRKTISGNYVSEVDGTGFFISPLGKNSPRAELEATLDLFQKAPERPWGYIQQPVICAFPTRKKFFEDRLQIKFKNIDCPDLEKWKLGLHAKAFYLIFSAAYPNNPASLFGHTFGLFSSHEPPDSAEGISDYAINFSADTNAEDEKSPFYTIRGLFGGYTARYRISPLYQMINQYVKWDSRDLWYLKVPLSPDQLDRLQNHIWELFTTTEFDYFFFDENCSYRLLAALDYADPSARLADEFRYRIPLNYVSPIATFKAVAARYPGAELNYTPSIKKTFEARLRGLSAQSLKNFYKTLDNPEKIKDETDVDALDALIAFYDYRKRIKGPSTSDSVLKLLELSLRTRAKILHASKPEPELPMPPSPLVAHQNLSFSVGLGRGYNGEFLEIGGKPGFHDMLSRSAGYDLWNHMNFFEFSARADKSSFEIRHIYLVDMMSFFPVTFYEVKPSWRVNLGYNYRQSIFAKAGPGLTWQSLSKNQILYGFLNPTVSRNGLQVEFEFGGVLSFSEIAKLRATYSNFWRARGIEEKIELMSSIFIGQNDELRPSVAIESGAREGRLTWQRNF